VINVLTATAAQPGVAVDRCAREIVAFWVVVVGRMAARVTNPSRRETLYILKS